MIAEGDRSGPAQRTIIAPARPVKWRQPNQIARDANIARKGRRQTQIVEMRAGQSDLCAIGSRFGRIMWTWAANRANAIRTETAFHPINDLARSTYGR